MSREQERGQRGWPARGRWHTIEAASLPHEIFGRPHPRSYFIFWVGRITNMW